jgi:hypothetical protein
MIQRGQVIKTSAFLIISYKKYRERIEISASTFSKEFCYLLLFRFSGEPINLE